MIENKEINRTFEKYPEYKDSGVDWLGEIPESWELISNKYIFNLKKNQVGKKSSDYVLLSLTLRGIIQRVLEDGGKFPAEFDTYQEVKKGDFVFCLFDVEETPRCIGLSDYEGMITGAYTVMDLKPGFSKRFLYYFYLNLDNDKRLRPLYTGLRNTISKDNFFSFKSFVPSFDEQTAIANFLDNKTSKIDTAIAQKEQMIALLKERKQIVIQNAVTGKWSMINGEWGKTPKEKMKDSGVEWLGEIPEHWMIKKMKYLGSIFPGLSGKKGDDFSKDYKENLKPFIPFTNICNNLKINDKQFQYVQVGEFEKQNRVQKNDILFLMSSETLEDIGKCSLYDGENKEIYLNSFCKGFRFRYNKLSSYYINYLLQGSIYRNYFSLVGRGFTRINLKQEYINDVTVILPPLPEQTTIATFLDNKTSKIDRAITLQQTEIEKLKEYKATLIDSAVTGKIKVTDE